MFAMWLRVRICVDVAYYRHIKGELEKELYSCTFFRRAIMQQIVPRSFGLYTVQLGAVTSFSTLSVVCDIFD